jgi:Ca2+:H+ antiporter
MRGAARQRSRLGAGPGGSGRRDTIAMISGLRALLPVLREEPPLLPTVTIFRVLRHRWLGDLSGLAWAAFLFVWLFAAIVWGAKTVVRHADVLAFRLGEPYETLILTMSVASIEIVTVVVVMLTGKQNPTLGRDTMFSVLMIVLNGLVGLGLLLGGLRYREQAYNPIELFASDVMPRLSASLALSA